MLDTANEISGIDFEYICALARRCAAIELETGKEYLVQSRLSPLIAKANCKDIGEFVRKVREEEYGPWAALVIDALTTNETLFFRDSHPFESLKTVILPELIQHRSAVKQLNIWSAAASTGQEAYSFSIMLKEAFPQLAEWSIDILGTDISPTALTQAQEGRYSRIEINRGLSASHLVRYFTQDANRWILSEDIRKMVHFREMNLIGYWGDLPTFDLVFLRNIMIYMSVDSRRKILNNLRRQMAPDGYLLLGSSENLLQTAEDFDPIEIENSLFYRPKG